MAEQGVLKQKYKNILKKWQKNIVLEKSCKNIHATSEKILPWVVQKYSILNQHSPLIFRIN